MDLLGDCTITDDCLQITCKTDFGGKTTSLTVNVNRLVKYNALHIGECPLREFEL